MEKPIKLTEGPIQSQLITLALPLLIGNIVQQFYNTIDTIIVGLYVGENPFAALGVAGTVMNLFIFVIAGGCTGVALIVATLYGNGDHSTLRREIFLATLFGTICTILLSIIALAFTPMLLQAIHTPQEITHYVGQYLNIIFIGLLATFMYNLLSATMRALGDTKMSLFFLLLAMLFNLFLDLLLVAKLNFGIAGAAWATVISQLLCACLCQFYILKRLPFLKIRPEDMRFDSSLIHKTAQFAFISALHQSSLYIGKLLVQGAVNSIGFAAISAYTATTRIEGIAQAFGNSGAESISVFVAQNTGAGNRARSAEGFKKGLILLTTLGLLISILMFFNARLLLSLFIPKSNEESITLGIRYIQIICCFYFLCFIGSAFVGYFRGTGQVKVPFLGTTLHIAIRVILSYLLVSKFSLSAVALATGVGWIFVVAFQAIIYSKSIQKCPETNGIPPVFEIFSDRFVITSSGGLPQELTQEEFFEGISAPRNKELMRVFRDAKLVEQLGSGVQRILNAYDRSIFKLSSNFLKVSFQIENAGKNAGKNALNLNKTQINIIELIKENKYITQEEISIKLDKNVSTIQRNMKKLQEQKLIKRIGSATDGY